MIKKNNYFFMFVSINRIVFEKEDQMSREE